MNIRSGPIGSDFGSKEFRADGVPRKFEGDERENGGDDNFQKNDFRDDVHVGQEPLLIHGCDHERAAELIDEEDRIRQDKQRVCVDCGIEKPLAAR
jgi:hypothetical protein